MANPYFYFWASNNYTTTTIGDFATDAPILSTPDILYNNYTNEVNKIQSQHYRDEMVKLWTGVETRYNNQLTAFSTAIAATGDTTTDISDLTYTFWDNILGTYSCDNTAK